MVLLRKKTISGKIFSKKICFRSAPDRGQKRSSFLQNHIFFSRNYHVAQKLEQLEQNNEKHLKAHSTGYQRLPIGFELKSVCKALEVIKGQKNVLCDNSFS